MVYDTVVRLNASGPWYTVFYKIVQKMEAALHKIEEQTKTADKDDVNAAETNSWFLEHRWSWTNWKLRLLITGIIYILQSHVHIYSILVTYTAKNKPVLSKDLKLPHWAATIVQYLVPCSSGFKYARTFFLSICKAKHTFL